MLFLLFYTYCSLYFSNIIIPCFILVTYFTKLYNIYFVFIVLYHFQQKYLLIKKKQICFLLLKKYLFYYKFTLQITSEFYV